LRGTLSLYAKTQTTSTLTSISKFIWIPMTASFLSVHLYGSQVTDPSPRDPSSLDASAVSLTQIQQANHSGLEVPPPLLKTASHLQLYKPSVDGRQTHSKFTSERTL
jgi:hypothetical protein